MLSTHLAQTPALQPNQSLTAIVRPFVFISPADQSAPPHHFLRPRPHRVGRRRSLPFSYQRGCRAATVAPADEAPPLVSPHRYSSRQGREASFRRLPFAIQSPACPPLLTPRSQRSRA